jgi:hypothetical protein
MCHLIISSTLTAQLRDTNSNTQRLSTVRACRAVREAYTGQQRHPVVSYTALRVKRVPLILKELSFCLSLSFLLPIFSLSVLYKHTVINETQGLYNQQLMKPMIK